MTSQLQNYADLLGAMAVQYAPTVLLALVTLLVGFKLVNIVVRWMHKGFAHQAIERSLAGFLESLVSLGLKALVLISVATMVGVQMTSFIAILGAASLAVGLSLQGSLSNLAGGMLILFFKPFVVGHDIEAMAHRGIVERIEMVSTLIRGTDGKLIIIPNGALSNSVVVNYSRK